MGPMDGTAATRHLLTIQYDGAGFHGWQRQPGRSTVEGILEDTLAQILSKPADLVGQGRTDSGVHALGQTAHVDLPSEADPERVFHSLNRLLPASVHVSGWRPVPADFHARFDAIARRYRYRVRTGIHVPARGSELQFDPGSRNARLLDAPDGHARLNAFAAALPGIHPFDRFCKAEPDLPHARCDIHEAAWIPTADGALDFIITGNRFLRHLVRRLVGTMLGMLDGEWDAESFRRLLKEPDPIGPGLEPPAGPSSGSSRIHPPLPRVHTAPAHGLTLLEVMYPAWRAGA